MKTFKSNIAILIAAVGISSTSAFGSVLVTIAEDAAQTTSSLNNTNTLTFNDLNLGNNYNVNWDGVGTIDVVHVGAANVWGGAVDESTGAGSNFAWIGKRRGPSSTITLTQQSSYFGFWWSAGNHINTISFLNGGSLVAEYTTSSMFNSLNLSSEYYGNPLTGGNTEQPYAFINFYGDENTTWDRIILSNPGRGAFEADNYTSRVEAFNTEIDDISDLGSVVAEVEGASTSVVDNSTTSWEWVPDQSAPGAPTPPIYALICFAGIFALKDKLKGKKAK